MNMKTVYRIAPKIILPALVAGMAFGLIGCNRNNTSRYDMKQVQAMYKQLDEMEAQSKAIDKYISEVADPMLAQAEADRKIDAAIKCGEIPKNVEDMTLAEILEDGLNQLPQPGDDEILKLYGINPEQKK